LALEQKKEGTGSSAVNAYKQNNLNINSQIKLVEMLYEGILRFNIQAKEAIEKNDIEKRVYWINRSASIFSELINALDLEQDGTISEYLQGLYQHQLKLLTDANAEHKTEPLDEVNTVVKGLLDAWRESNGKE
jgi:flagellar protein FliS